jgi:hypothetical protein
MMAKVPIQGTDSEFSIKADIIDKNGYQVPVFEVKVAKDIVLFRSKQRFTRSRK